MTSSNIEFAWVNLFDSATVTVAGAAADMPASFLQQVDVGRKCRVVGTSMAILATYATNQSADTFALFGVGDADVAAGAFLSSGTGRLRLSSSDATGAAGDVYDTTALSGLVDPNYQSLIHRASAIKTGWKFARWDLAQSGASYVQAGRGFIGTRTQVAYNFVAGAQCTVVDPSTKKTTDGGQTKIRVRPKYRVYEFNLQWVTEAQATSLVRAIDLANGAHVDLLMIFDPTSSNLGADSCWGLVDSVDPVSIPGVFDSAGGLIRSRAYKIVERL